MINGQISPWGYEYLQGRTELLSHILPLSLPRVTESREKNEFWKEEQNGKMQKPRYVDTLTASTKIGSLTNGDEESS